MDTTKDFLGATVHVGDLVRVISWGMGVPQHVALAPYVYEVVRIKRTGSVVIEILSREVTAQPTQIKATGSNNKNE